MSNFSLHSDFNGEKKDLKDIKLDPKMGYVVDFTKLKSVNDLILVLSALGISFPGDHPLIEHLKPFLNIDNPFPIQPKEELFKPIN